ncbi:MAG: hypothetical protein CMK07_05310 [Ponticaulis sp.]|nr:hypothetical protein [Ponticaulis sp.]
MKFPALLAIAGLTAVLAGCVIIDADSDDDWDASYSSDGERVYSADITDTGLTVRVAASGCTSKDFFDVDVDKKDDDTFTVELNRERRDYCKMMQPEGERLSWSFAELGIPDGATVLLRNPVGR